ncbi:hypothetical protein F4781DRAFT_438201 [Annulohypoxylon bovei var. microspora]|nr:hypothetical protein F4781DRAFT_438201 [Annulohypoxylon bovei var. microspora]
MSNTPENIMNPESRSLSEEPIPNGNTTPSPWRKELFQPNWPTKYIKKQRYVVVQKFQDEIRIDIRPWYRRDGGLIPTKQGISLTEKEFGYLISLVPEIGTEIREMRARTKPN